MKVRLLDVAELDEAVAWYRARNVTAARGLVQEVIAARDLIAAQPHAWHPLGDGVRRLRLKRFPYAPVYVVERDEALVLAVAHQSRRPDYWRDRLNRE